MENQASIREPRNNGFDQLNKAEFEFIELFLKWNGNFQTIHDETNIAKHILYERHRAIIEKLGLDDKDILRRSSSSGAYLSFSTVSAEDSVAVQHIKTKLNECGGKTEIRLLRGDRCTICYSTDGKGLNSDKIPVAHQLTWDVFTAVVELLIKSGGKAVKGNARSGKLGTPKLSLESVEGYIAHQVHGVQVGQSAFGPGFVVCAVLDWAGICRNERGYLLLNSGVVSSI
ncbi:hypothetical protein B5M42_021785 [Paenibacillus athensensis]|uniref:Uncharacterized protein n=1 Tax=Paenibacillus athensensis TaxID=1967502 RepID=A0A4Y8PWH4_9BACL|nr:hypothetical protein [Paenibacillus athensensis]MCD1261437.1 hypothetical protein [Paenibacillus athensensis]